MRRLLAAPALGPIKEACRPIEDAIPGSITGQVLDALIEDLTRSV
ncbi:hypothetical protein [Kribbella sp. NPDC055071]